MNRNDQTAAALRAAILLALCASVQPAAVAADDSADAAQADAGAETMAAAAASLPTDSVFSSESFWYTPIPAKAPLHEKSKQFVEEFQRQIKAHYGTVSINVKAYASPVYIAGPDVRTLTVTQWDCQRKGYLDRGLKEQWSAVPLLPGSQPAEGTDAEMAVYQPETDTLWEFWKMRKENGRWEACWGGRMQNVSQSSGIWPDYYGTTATGLPFMGGQITAEELQRGEIRHVIGIALVETDAASALSWPAVRSDGYNPGRKANRIPQGQRFRLDPAVQVDALNMHPVGKTIAKAAQKYGFVVWDKAGAITLRAENPKSYLQAGLPNPYPELFDGTPAYNILKGFPWGKLQFMPKDYGKP